MTGKGQFYLRMQTVLDRLAWGFGDLKRMLAERGVWPAVAHAVDSDGDGRWSVTGTRLRARKKDARKAAGLLVPESECLWGAMQLPDMPRRALGGAVDEAMWRVSPLPPDQIVAAWQAVPSPQGGWNVDWGVCRRSVQDELLARHGLNADAPVYLSRQGRAIAVRGAAWLRQRKRQGWADAAVVALLLLVLAAVAAPALMPLVLKRQAVVRAVQHVSVLEPKAAPLRLQLDELRRQSLVAEELRKAIGSDLPLASVVEGLSAALPDDTWLDRIEINGTEIRIVGLTTNAADLIARLGRQPAFAEVRATTANVRDNTLGKERFTFDMRWRGEGSKS